MATYFRGPITDISDWTERYNTSPTWTGADPLDIPPSAGNDWSALTWDDIDADADRDDVEVLLKYTTDASFSLSRFVIVRGSGADESATHYHFSVLSTACSVGYCSGSDTRTNLVSASFTTNASTTYWVRFRVVGTAIQARIWQDGSGEPGTWTIDTTDSTVTGAGWVGLSSNGTSSSVNALQIGVGTNGDTAPSSGGGSYDVSASETASANDTAAPALVAAGAVAETASAGDSAVAVLVVAAAAAEAASAGDAVASGGASYSVEVSEAAGAADAASVVQVMAVSAAEAGAAADTATATLVIGAAVSDVASAADATNWGGAVYNLEVSESATAADAVAAALQLIAAQSEAGAAVDAISVVCTFGTQLLEPAAAADAVEGARQMLALLTEPAVAADTVASTTGQVYSAAVAEAAAAADAVAVQVGPVLVVMSAAPLERRADGPGRREQLSTARRRVPPNGVRR